MNEEQLPNDLKPVQINLSESLWSKFKKYFIVRRGTTIEAKMYKILKGEVEKYERKNKITD